MAAHFVTEVLNIREKALLLGFSLPDGLVLLPKNLDTASSREQLAYESSNATIRKVLVQGGLEVRLLEGTGSEALPQSFEKNFDWLGPTILIGGGLMTQNPAAVTIALNMISAYLTDVFRGFPGGPEVKLTIYVERDGKKFTERIDYKGTANGLKDLARVIERVDKDD